MRKSFPVVMSPPPSRQHPAVAAMADAATETADFAVPEADAGFALTKRSPRRVIKPSQHERTAGSPGITGSGQRQEDANVIIRMREWWNDPPARGRHRQGLPLVPSEDCRREWDAAQRSAAARLDRIERAWTILYGLGRRRFYAIAHWPSDEPLIVEAPTPESLREQMREAEVLPSAASAPSWIPPRHAYAVRAA
ncbi:hypothetical protein AB0K60_25750 [Thermopolyspora sp. NPDC052614]|uniref:hypothetical protein n=1 Tax=Thermopolyspora sp. NPDC052614 TaxID=3155682 RepID=UPI00343C0F38